MLVGKDLREKSARRTLDAQVSAEEGLVQVYILDLDLHVVDLPLRLLCSSETATGPQK